MYWCVCCAFTIHSLYLPLACRQSASMLLATFEADSSSSSELKQAKRRRQEQIQKAVVAAAASAARGQEHLQHVSSSDPRRDYMGCKFLTSSQLFLLELQDPSIRQQVAIQLLVSLRMLDCSRTIDRTIILLFHLFDISVWCLAFTYRLLCIIG